jgi:hypothetical protein
MHLVEWKEIEFDAISFFTKLNTHDTGGRLILIKYFGKSKFNSYLIILKVQILN